MGLLDKILTGKRREPAQPAVITNPERLTTPEQIGPVLTHLLDDRKQVTVLVDGSDETYTSSILAVDEGRAILELDELNPRAGHELLAAQRRFRLQTRHKGIDIGFVAEVAAVDSSGGIAVYTVPFPDLVHYHPRRQAYRAEVDLSQRIPVFLELQTGAILQGELRDISVGGVGLELVRRPLQPLERGQTVEWCKVRLEDGREIGGNLEICFVSQPRGGQRTRIGGRFLNLRPQDNSALRQAVASLERQRIKRMKDK